MLNNLNKNFDVLNDAQKKATFHIDGPLIIIAGAGSGKTRVLTYRIAHLLNTGVDSFSILALTFTNKAAREMKSRISKIVGESEAKNLWMGTFHSIFAKILRIEADKIGFDTNFTIYDTQDSEKLIRSIIKEKNLDKDIYRPKIVRNRISILKNNLITVNGYFNNPELLESDKISKRPFTGNLYEEYVKRCFRSNVMDFDDLLLKTNELLNNNPEVLFKYQNKFKYILVDEYQDTNHSQYKIVKMLADRFQNICVVGDDSQSIYSFRGANIDNILNFKKDYPDSISYKLEQNYRSSKNIVNSANSILKYNKNKLEKTVWTNNNEGEKVLINSFRTDSDEGRFVVNDIIKNRSIQNKENRDFAILYRTNAQSRSIEDALRINNVPYKIFGGLSFYQRKEIKDVLAYLKLILNKNDEESLKRIINYPPRGIGQTTIDKLSVASNEMGLSIFEFIERENINNLKINNTTTEKLKNFVYMIKNFSLLNDKMSAYEITKEVIGRIGIIDHLKIDSSPEEINKIQNIEELLNGINELKIIDDELIDSKIKLSTFLEDVSLATDFDDKKNNNDNSVSLMTVHLAKGLEFSDVYIVGLEEDLFPSPMNIDSRNGLEEERRLFYVALTRAKNKVNISYSQTRYRWGNLDYCEPSRFISEIDPLYVENNSVNEEKNKIQIKSESFNSINKPNASMIKKLKKIDLFYKNKNVKKNIDVESGIYVYHERFGKGLVNLVEGTGSDRKASIDFEKFGRKKLLLNFAKLKILNKKSP